MASPDFWREIANQFRNIPEATTLTAEWADLADTGVGIWFLTGSNTARYSFEALAKRAAREITRGSNSDLLSVWLNELRRQHFGFKEMGFTVTSGPDEPEQKRCHSGRIDGICDVSANFCKKLEADEIQREFKENKQSRERNRAFMERYYEAKRPARELRGEPPEQTRPVSSRPKAVEPKTESVGEQLKRLRDECHVTAQELAELIDVEVRSFQRHLAGDSIPYDRYLRAYEREFSKLLNRKVVISKLS
jgi:hypothetical protein